MQETLITYINNYVIVCDRNNVLSKLKKHHKTFEYIKHKKVQRTFILMSKIL